MGDRAHRIGVDQVRGLRHRDTVASADEGVALDHRRQRRMHAARAEGDDLPLARDLLAARGLRGDAGGLAEQAEQRGLVLCPLDVDAVDHDDRLVGVEDRPFVHRLHVDGHAFQQRRDLFDARQNAPLPIVGEALQVDLGLDPLPVVAMPEDLDRPLEVDVGDVAALDVGFSGGMETALRRG